MRNVSNKSCRENQNTHFTFGKFFSPEKNAVYEIKSKKYSGGLEAADDNIAERCMLDN
jgi:hypothetical protein